MNIFNYLSGYLNAIVDHTIIPLNSSGPSSTSDEERLKFLITNLVIVTLSLGIIKIGHARLQKYRAYHLERSKQQEERSKQQELIQSLFEYNILPELIEGFTGISLDQKAEAIGQALLVPDMGFFDRALLIEAVTSIPFDQKAEVIAQALLVTSPDMNFFVRKSLIETVAAIPRDQRADVVAQAVLVFTPNMAYPYMAYLERESLIKTVAAIPQDQRADIITQALLVISPDMDNCHRKNLIETVAAISPDQRADVIAQALLVILPDMDFLDRKNLIETVAAIPQDQRAGIIAQALSEISPNMTAFQRRDLIQEYASQPQEVELNNQEFLVDRDHFNSKTKTLLLNYVDAIRVNNGRMPEIRYHKELGWDVGGLTRDFIAKLFANITEDKFNINSSLIHAENKEDCEIARAIGTIFGVALINQSFAIGQRFHDNLFQMIQSIPEILVKTLPVNLNSIDELEKLENASYNMLIEMYINIFFPKGVGGISNQEFADQYPEVKQRILAIANIAKSMSDYIIQNNKTWNNVVMLEQNLTQRIQGSVSKALFKQAISSNNNAAHAIKKWIDQADDEKVTKLLCQTTGSYTLLPAQTVHVDMANQDQAIAFHTCSNTIDVSWNQIVNHQLNFNELLNDSLENNDTFNVI